MKLLLKYLQIIVVFFVFFFNQLNSQKINESYRIHPKKTDQSIIIDGLLEEKIWESAEVADSFFMILPTDGKKANQHSEARVL